MKMHIEFLFPWTEKKKPMSLRTCGFVSSNGYLLTIYG